MTRQERIAKLRSLVRRGRRRIKQILSYNSRRRRLIKRLLAEQDAQVMFMFDDVETRLIPKTAPSFAGYVDGRWPNFEALRERFPHRPGLSIAVFAKDDADCLDVEEGDATPAEAVGWVQRQLQRRPGTRPAVYSSASVMPQILHLLAQAGIHRDQVRVFTAHYTYEPHLCGPNSCGELAHVTADATQYTDRAEGKSLDESRVSRDFFAR